MLEPSIAVGYLDIDTTSPPEPGELQTSATDSGELRMIPVSQLQESPWNPRKYFAEKPMAELVESVRAIGVWTPLIVRPAIPADVREHVAMQLYEVGAGHRRLRAARLAGLTEVPCIVRELGDEQFLDVLSFENCNREDPHPLEEAAGFRLNMEKNGRDKEAIAAKLGISVSQVYARLKLLELTEESRAAFWDGLISAGHADMIARLPPKEQKEAIQFCKPVEWDPGRTVSVLQLRSWIRQKVHVDLERAPFDKDSPALFPKAGACSTCPKRSANHPEFYPEAEGEDACTDPACYHEKLKAHLAIVREQLAKKGEFLEVSEGFGRAAKDGPLPHGEWETAREGEEKRAKPALVVDGYGVGKVIQVVTRQQQKKEAPAVQKAQQQAEEANRKRKLDREIAVRRKILDAVCDKVSGLTRADVEGLLVLLFDYHTDPEEAVAPLLCKWRGITFQECRETHALLAAIPKMPEPELYRCVIEAGVVKDFDECRIQRDEKPEALLALAKRYKVDAVKIRLQEEEKLKSQEGTRKEVVSKLPTLTDQQQKSAAKKPTAKKAPAKKAAKPAKKKAAKK